MNKFLRLLSIATVLVMSFGASISPHTIVNNTDRPVKYSLSIGLMRFGGTIKPNVTRELKGPAFYYDIQKISLSYGRPNLNGGTLYIEKP